VTVSDADILALVQARVGSVLGVGPARVRPQSRFADELGADSLDLLEIVESVERELRGRGIAINLPDSELLTLTTVGDVAERLAAQLPGATGAEAGT
jgi:acyl carrier protein